MQNGFLLVRAVFLALLLLFSLLTLSFAAWNIDAALRATQTVPVTSAFIVFESCLFCICVVLAFVELCYPRFKTSRISFECSWVALIALFQLGAAISATINGPAFLCRATANADLCASMSLLVQSMWLKSLVCFAYFFSLFITALIHSSASHNIWSETIYTMDWFNQGPIARIELTKDMSWDQCSQYFDDIESSSARKRNHPLRDSAALAPIWAQNATIKRGVDNPFSAVSPRPSQAGTSKSLPPVPPLKLLSPKASPPSRFIEKFRESRILSRIETPSQYGNHFMNNDARFPSIFVDHDKPIPLPRLSEWVRADALKSAA